MEQTHKHTHTSRQTNTHKQHQHAQPSEQTHTQQDEHTCTSGYTGKHAHPQVRSHAFEYTHLHAKACGIHIPPEGTSSATFGHHLTQQGTLVLDHIDCFTPLSTCSGLSIPASNAPMQNFLFILQACLTHAPRLCDGVRHTCQQVVLPCDLCDVSRMFPGCSNDWMNYPVVIFMMPECCLSQFVHSLVSHSVIVSSSNLSQMFPNRAHVVHQLYKKGSSKYHKYPRIDLCIILLFSRLPQIP